VTRSTEIESGGLQALALTMLIPRWMLSYIGAGTGSLIIQVVIATTVGGLFALKLYWRRIKAFFLRRKATREEAGLPAEAGESAPDEGEVRTADGPGHDEDEALRSIEAELLPAPTMCASKTDQEESDTGIPLSDTQAEEQGGRQ